MSYSSVDYDIHRVETSKVKKHIQHTVFLNDPEPKRITPRSSGSSAKPYLIIASDYTLEEAFSTTILTFYMYVCNVLIVLFPTVTTLCGRTDHPAIPLYKSTTIITEISYAYKMA